MGLTVYSGKQCDTHHDRNQEGDTCLSMKMTGSQNTESVGAKVLHILFTYLVYFQSPPLECKLNES